MFDVSKHLGGATMRAKSDVANKLVGMFLHEVSRKISARIGLGIRDSQCPICHLIIWSRLLVLRQVARVGSYGS